MESDSKKRARLNPAGIVCCRLVCLESKPCEVAIGAPRRIVRLTARTGQTLPQKGLARWSRLVTTAEVTSP